MATITGINTNPQEDVRLNSKAARKAQRRLRDKSFSSLHNDPNKAAKWIIKFLAIEKDPKIARDVLRRAPDKVIKSIATLAYNLEQNPDVRLTPAQKAKFRSCRSSISALTSPNKNIAQKRSVLTNKTSQKGGVLPILPLLIKTGLGILGSGVLNSILGRFTGAAAPSQEGGVIGRHRLLRADRGLRGFWHADNGEDERSPRSGQKGGVVSRNRFSRADSKHSFKGFWHASPTASGDENEGGGGGRGHTTRKPV